MDGGIARADVVLTSKFGEHVGEEQRVYGGAEVTAALGQSLAALGTDYIDVCVWPENSAGARL